MSTEGFVIKCLKCGKEIRIPDSRVNESDHFIINDVEVLVDVYETININCGCGNFRE